MKKIRGKLGDVTNHLPDGFTKDISSLLEEGYKINIVVEDEQEGKEVDTYKVPINSLEDLKKFYDKMQEPLKSMDSINSYISKRVIEDVKA